MYLHNRHKELSLSIYREKCFPCQKLLVSRISPLTPKKFLFGGFHPLSHHLKHLLYLEKLWQRSFKCSCASFSINTDKIALLFWGEIQSSFQLSKGFWANYLEESFSAWKTAIGTEKSYWERSSLLRVCTGSTLVYNHQALVVFFLPKTVARKTTVTSCALCFRP